MDLGQAVWRPAPVERRRSSWPLHKDLLAVAVMCVIFGLQILALVELPGGSEAYGTIAAEGMQSP